jgi:hypothetical protein
MRSNLTADRPVRKLISTILLGYYLVMAVALLVFLVLRRIGDRREANRQEREIHTRRDGLASPGTHTEHEPESQVRPAPGNVLRFRRDK